MAKTLNFTYKDKEYTLEFTRRTVSEMERRGFTASDLTEKVMSTLPELFAGRLSRPSPLFEAGGDRRDLLQNDKQGGADREAGGDVQRADPYADGGAGGKRGKRELDGELLSLPSDARARHRYSETFREQFPFYLSVGMTEGQYWDGRQHPCRRLPGSGAAAQGAEKYRALAPGGVHLRRALPDRAAAGGVCKKERRLPVLPFRALRAHRGAKGRERGGDRKATLCRRQTVYGAVHARS